MNGICVLKWLEKIIKGKWLFPFEQWTAVSSCCFF